MQLGHHRKHPEHQCSRIRIAAPILSLKGFLYHSLAGTEAVENGASLETRTAELAVDAASEIGLEVRAWDARTFAEREIR